MATRMEILQVQRIVVDLFDSWTFEMLGANLELDNENYPVNYEHKVDSFAHSRDWELEKNLPRHFARECAFQENNLRLPSVFLLMFKTETVATRQRTEYLIIICSQKFGNARIEVGGVDHAWIIRNSPTAG